MRFVVGFIFLLAVLALVLLIRPLVHAANFPVTGRALAENTGAFLDFDNHNSQVFINMTHQKFSGYVFSEDLGWVAFGEDHNPGGPVTYDEETGLLTGKAYVLNTGAYLDFDLYNSNVTIDLETGTFSGYGFSEDIGWINFSSPGVSIDTDFPVDTTEPEVNASNISMQSAAANGHIIPDGGWSNSFAPYFSWDSGSNEEESPSLKGYCLYLGTEANADPGNHLSEAGTAGLLINSPVSTTGTPCQFIVAGTSLDLSTDDYLASSFVNDETYYLRIKAIDDAGNTYNQGQSNGSAAASLSFSFDSLPPENVAFINPAAGTFNNVDEMNFSWPISPSNGASSDTYSGVLGWQYAIKNTNAWFGSETHPTLGIDFIPALNLELPYYLTNERDGDVVEIGDNVIYFRTVDEAGNTSPPATYRTGSLAYGGDAPMFTGDAAVSVTPDTNTSNEFALSWPAAEPAEGRSVDKYYYMINTTPPVTLATLNSNPGTYIPTTSTSVAAGMLPGVQKGSNNVQVVAVDDEGNYSSSNFISGSFTLNSEIPDPAKNLTASDASIKAASLWRASLAWDHPDYRGTGDLTYTVQRSTDGHSWTTITTTSGTAYVDTVSDSRQYYWRIGTSDTTADSIASPSYTNAVTLTPKGSFTDPATLTSGPEVKAITTRKADIVWTTNRDSDSKIAYGTESGKYFDEEPSNSSQVTDHKISLTNLLPGTTYYYQARWTDEDGNTGKSEEKRFTTESAPTVTDPQATQIGLSNTILRYTVKGASSVKIYYGRSTAFGGMLEVATSREEVTLTTELTELEDGSLYYYKVNPVDSEGFEYEGQALTFETMPRPRISNVRLQEVAGSAQTTVLVSWSVNTPMSSVVSYYPTGQASAARDEVDAELRGGEHQMTVSGLLPQQQYQLLVKGRDRAGNEAISDTFNFTTATDTRPPQIINLKVIGGTIPPVGFAAGDIKAQLVVTWDTDEPATSQVEFGAGTSGSYSQKTQEDGNLTTNHTVIISGLTPSQVYHLRAITKDAAGNEARSIDVTTIAPKATRSAFDLVIENLASAFSFLGLLRQ